MSCPLLYPEGHPSPAVHLTDTQSRLEAALAGRYTPEQELGRGGMATVYLARDLKHDRHVALKVLRPELAASLGTERFLREVYLTARLDHPHILSVLDSGEANGLLWYTMPYVRGETLRSRLAREIQLPLEVALDITRQVASALDYAHRAGVVHRDLKPENILIADGQARVADFGIAKAVAGAGTEALTDTGLAVGTPAYMSPEQASGGQVDARTDVYALGCVLYEMLAGEPPYTGPTPAAVLAKRFMQAPAPLAHLRPGLPASVDGAVRKALAQVSADRFVGAAEFARALDAALPTTLALQQKASAGPSQRRVWVWVLGLGLALVTALAGWLVSRPEPSANDAAPPRLAVLPFDNLGDSADAYFAAGLTDEIRGRLSAVPGLQVIASTSSNQYALTHKQPEEIGRELGVRYLLLGRVRWARAGTSSSRVRVDPELVDLASGAAPTTRWQQPFDAPLTDVFEVQANIATRVANELSVTLTPAGRRQLAQVPTRSLAAYDAYLRGDRALSLGDMDDAHIAYREAIGLDSTFALAWAALAWTHGGRYHRGSQDPAEAEAMRAAAEKAHALAPDLPDAHARLGEYQSWVRRDNAAALRAYRTGLRLAPNNSLLLSRVGWAEMRLGRWDSAVAHLELASQLDPRSAARIGDAAFAHQMLRQNDRASKAMQLAQQLAPARPGLVNRQLELALSQGDTSLARRLVERLPQEIDVLDVLTEHALWPRTWLLGGSRLRELASRAPGDSGRTPAQALVLVEANTQLGDSAGARAAAKAARSLYEQSLVRSPSEAELHAGLGVVLAYLGLGAQAVREGMRAKTIVPVTTDAIAGPIYQAALVRIHMLTGEPQEALAELSPLLAIPGPLSPARLSVDPTFDPLRRLPGFESLLPSEHGRP